MKQTLVMAQSGHQFLLVTLDFIEMLLKRRVLALHLPRLYLLELQLPVQSLYFSVSLQNFLISGVQKPFLLARDFAKLHVLVCGGGEGMFRSRLTQELFLSPFLEVLRSLPRVRVMEGLEVLQLRFPQEILPLILAGSEEKLSRRTHHFFLELTPLGELSGEAGVVRRGVGEVFVPLVLQLGVELAPVNERPFEEFETGRERGLNVVVIHYL